MKALTLVIMLLLCSISFLYADVVWSEDFESGWGSWWADNGVWDVGIPSVGPVNTHSGQNCTGTVLDGNYPSNANTRLISPEITLPTISGDESILLKYWQWFEIENEDDQGIVQISINSGEWQAISNPDFDGTSTQWTQYATNLSDYAGFSIRIAFYFSSDYYTNCNGWYIDDISIETDIVIFPNPENFELGIGNWFTDNGLWEVGIPSTGPDSTHSGQNCAGTVLDGNYSSYTNTRLISPNINLTPIQGETPWLFFYHWFIIENGDDVGVIQISENGGEWQTVSSQFTGTNETWSQFGLDLSDFINSTIRIAFYLTTDYYTNCIGWYIDDIRIEGVTGVDKILNINSNEYILNQNYPNPFNPTTMITFSIIENCNVELFIYNFKGQKVKQLISNQLSSGEHSIIWNGDDDSGSSVSSGIYFYKLNVNGRTEATKKCLLLK
ncbi:MAG: choice-of-anchor J domain-containing protein [Melioribacteraceae bacterium]|nr:choice-of-anchor J domain-containing protein [Melioribacteraceae bacterium]